MRTVVVAALVACSSPAAVKSPEPAPDPASPPAATAPAPASTSGPPVAQPRVVRDTYHGVVVEDPFQWLEGAGADVKQWTDGQNRHARAVLDKLDEVEAMRGEVAAIVRAPITYYGGFRVGGGRLFGIRKQPAKEQSELIVLADPDDVAGAKLVLDPTADGNKHRSIDWFVPAPDGSRVAVSISEHGSEKGDLHVIDLDGKDVEPVIPNVQRGTGGGSVAWARDGKGFFYTRYPAAGERPDDERDFWLQVWFHAIGTPVASDRYELGKELPKIAEVLLEADARGRVLAKVQNGDGDTYRHYLRDAKGAWRQLTDWDDQVKYVGFGPTEELWLVSRKDAPRGKVMKLAATAPLARATVVVPEGKDSIVTAFWGADQGIVDGGKLFYLNYQVGGPGELRAFTRTGAPAKAPPLPPVSAIGKPLVWKDGILVTAISYITPRTYYRYTPATGALVPIAGLSPKPPVDLSGFEVHRELATSKDGTRIPVNIVWPKGAPRDGSVPCVVTGYGGYNLSASPGFVAGWAPLLRRGFCWASVNLRGGGEFGAEWHRAGQLTNKQNVFDDFAAALGFLVDGKYTRRERLGIIGGSNGGLLMGALLTQHPDLVKAVVADVGIFDMLRVERSTNGQYNIPEFGTVKDLAQFKALHAYSPYHHVVATAKYPAVLLMTGAHDARVEPWHSRKMAAALQRATRGGPVLLRVADKAGHGSGTDTTEVIDRSAQQMAFFRWQLK